MSLTIEYMALAEIQGADLNPKRHHADLGTSIERFGFADAPIMDERTGKLVAGHGRLEQLRAMAERGETAPEGVEVTSGSEGSAWHVPVQRGWSSRSDAEAAAFLVAHNKIGEAGGWDENELAKLLAGLEQEDTLGLGITDEDLTTLLASISEGGPNPEPKGAQSLTTEFLAPPFSVLDARQGYWQERKREWKAMGVSGATGRGPDLMGYGSSPASLGPLDTSLFDPVLAELAVRWFSPEGGLVLDPFAGGVCRGFVSAVLGRRYVGMDIRQEQVDANEAAWKASGRSEQSPEWLVGDSSTGLPEGLEADLVMSCPPYFDLESYEGREGDLSSMTDAAFRPVYRRIVGACADRLRQDRFAVFVVGEVRGKGGGYRGLIQLTVDAFEEAGLTFYNDAVLLTAIATAPMRARGMFSASRKLCRIHQNVLVFVKGDARKATEACGEVKVAWPSEDPAEEFGETFSG